VTVEKKKTYVFIMLNSMSLAAILDNYSAVNSWMQGKSSPGVRSCLVCPLHIVDLQQVCCHIKIRFITTGERRYGNVGCINPYSSNMRSEILHCY
jgi:hypothetical protein